MLDRTTTVRAESVEKAIQQGLAELQIEEKDAEIRVISEGKKGFLGFGKQDAVVHISAKFDDLSMRELTQQLEAEAGIKTPQHKNKSTVKPSKTADYIRSNNQQKDITADLEFSNQQDNEEKPPVPLPQKNDVVAVNSKPLVEEPSLDETVEAAPLEEAIESQSNDTEKDSLTANRETEPIEEPSAAPVIAEEKSKDPEVTETNKEDIDYSQTRQAVCNYLEQVIQEYGAQAQVTYKNKGNQVIFNIETDKSGLVIGKHGKIINALQTLVQVMIHRSERRRTTILLNVGDYRDRRSSVLEQMAQRTADQVLKTKQTVILDPLPAYERKQIHAYLSRVDHISTHSEGKDPNRYLVVDYVP